MSSSTGGSFSGGECADGVALKEASGVAISLDGRNVYVASFFSSAVAAFARDRKRHFLAVAH